MKSILSSVCTILFLASCSSSLVDQSSKRLRKEALNSTEYKQYKAAQIDVRQHYAEVQERARNIRGSNEYEKIYEIKLRDKQITDSLNRIWYAKKNAFYEKYSLDAMGLTEAEFKALLSSKDKRKSG